MCNTCNGTGAVHFIQGSSVLFQQCKNCHQEERKARRKRFNQKYERVKGQMQLRRAVIIQELERQGIFETAEGKPLTSLSLNELEKARIRLPELREVAETK
ncbi:hypothetical protein [Evansella tamaricis]|uniref:Uncharacterized protein n=1 Tax=Evansella tamaricis TaxID=2069301 RepID=A0ABS6JF57_9BACI|nr:hypothetical protein [Evansella tamaricis]MBU9711095.1 hypothetical protein [Evansella tamaricis]